MHTEQIQQKDQYAKIEMKIYIFFVIGGTALLLVIIINISCIMWYTKQRTLKNANTKLTPYSVHMEDK
jgi:hypothetical protein